MAIAPTVTNLKVLGIVLARPPNTSICRVRVPCRMFPAPMNSSGLKRL